VGIQCLKQIMEGIDQLVVAQSVVDAGTLFASTQQVEVQELAQVFRGSRWS